MHTLLQKPHNATNTEQVSINPRKALPAEETWCNGEGKGDASSDRAFFLQANPCGDVGDAMGGGRLMGEGMGMSVNLSSTDETAL